MPAPQVTINTNTSGIASVAPGYNFTPASGGNMQTLPPYMSITEDGRVVFDISATNNQVFQGLALLGAISPEDLAWFQQWNEGSGQDPTRLAQIFNDPNRSYAEFELLGLDATNLDRFERALAALQSGKDSSGFQPSAQFTNTYIGPTTPGQDYDPNATSTRPVFIGQPPTGGTPEQPYFSAADILVTASQQPNLYDTYDPYATYERPDPYSGEVQTYQPYQPAPPLAQPTLPDYTAPTPPAPTPALPESGPVAPPTTGTVTDPNTRITFGGSNLTPQPEPAYTPTLAEQRFETLFTQPAIAPLSILEPNLPTETRPVVEPVASETVIETVSTPAGLPQALDINPSTPAREGPVTPTTAPGVAPANTPWWRTAEGYEQLKEQERLGVTTGAQQRFLKGLQEGTEQFVVREEPQSNPRITFGGSSFAQGGIVSAMEDAPMTGQGIESFLVKYQSPESAMRDRRAATLRRNLKAIEPRPTVQSGIMPMARR